MWPWEHLAVGYVAYSLLVHFRSGHAPRPAPVVALAIGTQFPDLVDKPLAWTFAVLPSGHSLAHSLLVALPATAFAITVAAAFGRTRIGAAFAFGYLSHIPADVIFPFLLGERLNFSFLLWPLGPPPKTEPGGLGFFGMVRTLFNEYAVQLVHGDVTAYLAIELALMVSVVALWVYDGMPPFSVLIRRGRPEETP